MYEYDQSFYHYINQGSVDSARKLLPKLLDVLPEPVESVLDVGCGAGAWLNVWKSLGAEVVGLDGNYVSDLDLLIQPGEFIATDLRRDFALDRRFGLVQSLEVAEHLPESSAAIFVACLCRHSDMILFSAAPPGQGGENHINEQPYDYWREKFREQGYSMYDPVRASLAGDAAVKRWYRYNTFLYVSDVCHTNVRTALSAFRVDDTQPVPDVSPAIYRFRKRLIRMLPSGASTFLAVLKKSLFAISSKLKRGIG
jgi:SAM-dependent methyltransferase